MFRNYFISALLGLFLLVLFAFFELFRSLCGHDSIVFITLAFSESLSDRDGSALLELYVGSATRLAPFLLLLLGPARIILDMTADILLYILPHSSLSSKGEITARLRLLLQHISKSAKEGDTICLFAHSQGTQIAIDTVPSVPGFSFKLATTGSPVSTLYERFLGMSDWREQSYDEVSWRNFYRPSDFVGGPIASNDVGKQELDEDYDSHHLNYWGSATVIRWLVGWDADRLT